MILIYFAGEIVEVLAWRDYNPGESCWRCGPAEMIMGFGWHKFGRMIKESHWKGRKQDLGMHVDQISELILDGRMNFNDAQQRIKELNNPKRGSVVDPRRPDYKPPVVRGIEGLWIYQNIVKRVMRSRLKSWESKQGPII